MSRNLCSSYCQVCFFKFKLEHLRGQPLEFRRYASYSPVAGVKVECPTCGTFYFAVVRQHDHFWGREFLQSGD